MYSFMLRINYNLWTCFRCNPNRRAEVGKCGEWACS